MTPTRRRAPARPGLRSTRGRPVRGGAMAPPRWRRWALPALLTVATLVAVVLYFTPLLGVRSVQVVGNSRLGQDEVVRAAGIESGTPMLQVDVDEIRARLQAVPKIAAAQVSLSWPSTVRVQVTERIPVAFLVARNGIQLVDADGVPFDVVPQLPADLPELRVRAASQNDATTRAAMTVLMALPQSVRAEVTAVIAERSNAIRLLLTGDREVAWGALEETPRKAAILPPLLTRPGKVYDVTTPALPTVA
ncbi:cell division protein FtsQ/DivIB [Saccharopolyspora phatthalungensis]|uniref:Cell division protein FtsQ n=1 Tax=Saccharopolyspora phatthalungensis TaxID=664693 RepID=A0A840PZK8_9PSEU|nr:FtsQ-type POTRA domain-containing protein [Saccharopolyspora phatthalungensis]MBB5155712.1 cell division protein FtsQ [Saccharopolyspora phatthalungensis]